MGPMHSYYGKNIKDTNEKGEKYPFKESLQKTRNFPTNLLFFQKSQRDCGIQDLRDQRRNKTMARQKKKMSWQL